MKVAVDKIKIGDRWRDEPGDVAELAQSIHDHGLLQAIAVDDALNLIAGQRRLEAVKQLGWTHVDVRKIGERSQLERRQAELEENIRRSDFTAAQRARATAELAEMLRLTLGDSPRVTDEPEGTEDFCADSARVSDRPAHRPPDPTSTRQVAHGSSPGPAPDPQSDVQVAAAIGISPRTLNRRERLAKALDCYPELETAPEDAALKIAADLDALPPGERDRKRDELRATVAADVKEKARQLKQMMSLPPVYAAYGKARGLILRTIKLDDLNEEWTADQQQEILFSAPLMIERLQRLIQHVEGNKQLRVVKGGQ